MNEPQSAAEAVANGAQLLDEKMPDWWRQISLDELELSSCEACVCGQLARNIAWDSVTYGDPYDQFLNQVLELHEDEDHGFNEPSRQNPETGEWSRPWTFNDLDVEWHKVIDSRLQADTLAITEKEVASADLHSLRV